MQASERELSLKKSKEHINLVYVIAGVVAIFLCRIYQFFRAPDLASRFHEFTNEFVTFVQGVVMCTGALILFFLVIWMWMSVSQSITEIRFRRVIQESKSYPVRGYPVQMKKIGHGPIPENLAEEPDQELSTPIYCNLTITNHGVCITANSTAQTQEQVPNHQGIPPDFFTRGLSNPVFIYIGGISLYYAILQYEGGTVHRLTPADKAGFTGPLPEMSNEDVLEIVILFQNYVQRSNLHKIETLDQPLKLKLTVLNDSGEPDRQASSQLYAAISNGILQRELSQQDDDSWMYRSRPILW